MRFIFLCLAKCSAKCLANAGHPRLAGFRILFAVASSLSTAREGGFAQSLAHDLLQPRRVLFLGGGEHAAAEGPGFHVALHGFADLEILADDLLRPGESVGAVLGRGVLVGGHLRRGMSRGDAKELGELLEGGEAALIVVGESRIEEQLVVTADGTPVGSLSVANASATINASSGRGA